MSSLPNPSTIEAPTTHSKLITLKKKTPKARAARRTFPNDFIRDTLSSIEAGNLKISNVTYEGKKINAGTIYQWMKKPSKNFSKTFSSAFTSSSVVAKRIGFSAPIEANPTRLDFYKKTLQEFAQLNAELQLEIRLLRHELTFISKVS